MELLSLHCLAHYLLFLATLSVSLPEYVGGQSSENTNLTFMLIISYGEFGFNSSGGLPAAEMALEDINSDPDVLPGYNLLYDRIRNSQVIPPIAVHLVKLETRFTINYYCVIRWHKMFSNTSILTLHAQVASYTGSVTCLQRAGLTLFSGKPRQGGASTLIIEK